MREKEFLPLVSEKLGIPELNDMQKQMMASASEKRDIILLSPTGSGKTLAFLLPMLKLLKPTSGRIQTLIIAPTRELVIQIFSVVKNLTPGYKTTVLYGGHKVEDEVNSLSVTPDILISTPGRLCDHLKRGNTDILNVGILVLDEFDKTLELGFEKEMKRIFSRLKNLNRIILTSATDIDELPEFIKLNNVRRFNFLNENDSLEKRLHVATVLSDNKDKLESLLLLLKNLSKEGLQRTVVFVNHRESAERVAEFLKRRGVSVSLYHGALDQRDREKAIVKFNNGTDPILVATDLASRGLDISDVKNIIHYHQPLTEEVYTHRNGRTARIDKTGDVYILLSQEEELKDFIRADDSFELDENTGSALRSDISTIYFGAGKKEKLSRGDILGFLVKEAGFEPQEIGKIDIFDHYALVAILKHVAKEEIAKLKGKKIKGLKCKIELER